MEKWIKYSKQKTDLDTHTQQIGQETLLSVKQ